MNNERKKEEELTNVFIDFKSEFERQNTFLKILFGIIALLSVVCIALTLIQKNLHIFMDVPFLRNEISKVDACGAGMSLIIQNRPSEYFINENLIKNMKRLKINYSFEIEKWFRPWMIDETTCRFVFQTDKGFVGFKVKMESKKEYMFNHRVYDFDEYSIDIKKGESWKL